MAFLLINPNEPALSLPLKLSINRLPVSDKEEIRLQLRQLTSVDSEIFFKHRRLKKCIVIIAVVRKVDFV